MRFLANRNQAIRRGQAAADANGAPVAILARDGWYTVSEEPPDDMEAAGWEIVALLMPPDVDLDAEGWR